jgi:hypothetical protein
MQPILFLASAAIIHGLGMHAAAAGLPSDVMRRPHWLSVSSAPDSTSNYTLSRHTILGPRGWDCKGVIGADGTVLVLIRSSPPEQKQRLERRTVVCEVQDGDQVDRLLAESKEYLLFEGFGACVGCALSVACEFFKSAAEHDVIADIGCLRRDPASVTFRSDSIVEFERKRQTSDSPGKSSHVSGAVFYRPDGEHGFFAARLSCHLRTGSVCHRSIRDFRARAAREAPE